MHLLLIATALIVILAAGIVALLAAVAASKAVRTGYRQPCDQLSERAITSLTAVRARTLPAGPRRELAELRQQLRRSRAATRRLLADATGPLGDLPDWVHQLDRATSTLDRQLAALQLEPEPAALSEALALLRPQVHQANTASSELRAVLRRAHAATQPAWADLAAGIHDEARAVTAGIDYLHTEQTASNLLATR